MVIGCRKTVGHRLVEHLAVLDSTGIFLDPDIFLS